MGYVNTDHGVVLRATASGDVAKMNLIVQQAYAGGGVGPEVVFTVTQPAADGSWQTTAPLNLPYGVYWLSYQTFAPDGTASPVASLGGNPMPFKPLPVFHDTAFSAGLLSYMNPIETATGRLTTYDPNTGDTGTPWTGPVSVEINGGLPQDSADNGTTQSIAADGSWSVSFQPIPETTGSEPISLQAELPGYPCPGCDIDTVAGPTTTVPIAADQSTRIVLDNSTTAGATAGTDVTVSGTLEYQDTTGWHPVSGGFVFLGGNGTWSATQSYTNAAGRFHFTMAVPDSPITWPVYTSYSSYLDPSQSSYSITSVNQQLTLALNDAAVDAHDNLTFTQRTGSSNGTIPGGHVYLQQSSDGRTGWTTIATLPARSSTAWSTVTHQVSDPHGYWRLYSPATPGYASATSNTIHTFRYQSRLLGGPATTSAHTGQAVRFSGYLQQQGYGAWTTHADAIVDVLFRPHGSSLTYTMGTARTNGQGYFATDVKITGSGTWYLSYQAPNRWYTDTTDAGTYIHLV